MNKTGLLLVVSGPSGAGKSTVLRHLIDHHSNIMFSVSATTRPPRPQEEHGVHYRFVSEEEFSELIMNDELLEYVNYAGNRYGTLKKPVFDSIKAGKVVVLDIEERGAFQIKSGISDCIMIYLAPSDMQEVEKRLRMRGTENEEHIAQRLSLAYAQREHIYSYDYYVCNDSIEEASRKLLCIIEAEQCKIARVPNIKEEANA
ncbi:MAG: guanylate kinase [Oscillospiraceae bacterium]|jgi:guanylate kinase|nr:guanylate kinase [Oscillospiraceae bacterium]